MKIQILSDLHNEMYKGNPPDIEEAGADVIVLDGDIATGTDGIEWAIGQSKRLGVPIVYIAGNHEYYHHEYESLLQEMRKLASESSEVYFLEKDSMSFCKNDHWVEFVGTTCWTGFWDMGDTRRATAMIMAKESMNDYRIIHKGAQRLTPEDTAQFYEESTAWLLHQFTQINKAKAVATEAQSKWTRVVVTHHGPSPECHNTAKHGQANEMSLNFWSDLETYINPQNMALWIYGHTHSNLRFNINNVPIVCNQRGYPHEGVEGFDPKYIVEV